MSFSFCLNKNALLLLSSFGLLYQGLDLNRKGKLMQDSQRLVCSAITILERNAALGSAEFKGIACAMISVDRTSKPVQAAKANTSPKKKPSGKMEASQAEPRSGRKQLQAMAARFSTGNIATFKQASSVERRATAPATSTTSIYGPQTNQPCISSAMELHRPLHQQHDVNPNLSRSTSTVDVPNLDYLSFDDDTGPTPNLLNSGVESATQGLNMDEFTDCLASPPSFAHFDSVFTAADLSDPYITSSPPVTHQDWGLDLWTLAADVNTQTAAQSVLSFTESELASGEDWTTHDGTSEYRGMATPHMDGFGLEALHATFGA